MREYSGAVTKPRRKPTTQEAGQKGAFTHAIDRHAVGCTGEPRAYVLLGRDMASPGEVLAWGKEASGNIYPGYCRINAIILLLW